MSECFSGAKHSKVPAPSQVGESVAQPMRYYHNNITGTLNLLALMTQYDCKRVRLFVLVVAEGPRQRSPCVRSLSLRPSAVRPAPRCALS